jgi:hypothetical protein
LVWTETFPIASQHPEHLVAPDLVAVAAVAAVAAQNEIPESDTTDAPALLVPQSLSCLQQHLSRNPLRLLEEEKQKTPRPLHEGWH